MGVAEDFTILARVEEEEKGVEDMVAERKTLMEHSLGEIATHNIVQADLSYPWGLSERVGKGFGRSQSFHN